MREEIKKLKIKQEKEKRGTEITRHGHSEPYKWDQGDEIGKSRRERAEIRETG